MKKILVFLTLLVTILSFGQQMPPSIKWRQIKTKHFRIIYPKEVNPIAQDIANNLEALYFPDAESIKGYPRWRVPVVLNNLSVISNGYTRVAPRKIHLYLTPYPSTYLGSERWISALAIHEYRHMVQFKALDKNLVRMYHLLSGDIGWAVGLGFTAPMWWLEGDAVFHETVYSQSGRGRSGIFAMPVKAITLQYPGKKLNYYRFYYRSYKTFYPNWYYLGYYMVTYFNKKYSPQAWDKVIRTSTKFAFLPNSMNLGLRLKYKTSFRKLFDSTFVDLKNYWTNRTDSLLLTGIQYIPHHKKRTFTNYADIFALGNDKILAVKTGFDNAPTLTLIDHTGREHHLKQIPAYHISAAKNLVTWTDVQPDMRWEDVYHAKIALYDITRQKLSYLPVKGKIQSPRLSDDGQLLVAVQYDNHLQPELLIFDTKQKKLTNKIALHSFEAVRQPSFSHDNSKITFTGTNPAKGLGLFVLDLKTKQIDTIIDFTWQANIDNPVFWHNYIIFSSDLDGTNNIFAVNTQTKQIYRVVYRPYGALYPNIDHNRNLLYFSDYTINGFEPAKIQLDPKNWTKVSLQQANRENYFYAGKTKNLLHDYSNPQTLPKKTYTPTKYNHLLSWLNLHSWLPVLMFDPQNFSLENSVIGMNLFANDILDETNWTLSSLFSPYKELINSFNFRLKRFYPVFDFTALNKLGLADTIRLNSAGISMTLPFNLSQDIWYRKLNASIGAYYTNLKTPDRTVNYPLLTSKIAFKNMRDPAYRDVNPRLAQGFLLSYSRTLNTNDQQFTAIAAANLPGFLRHDVFTISAQFQKISGDYAFDRNVTISRGYKPVLYHQITKISVTEHLPLFYPDFGIKPLFFVKRVRAKIFYDYAMADQNLYRSVGSQLLFDFNLFGYPFELSGGVQIAYLIDQNTWNLGGVFLDLPLNF